MYIYIYDSFTQDKRFTKHLLEIESRLLQLGIPGSKIIFQPTKHFICSLKESLENGASTIVAIGNDKTLFQTINLIGSLRTDFRTLSAVTLGYIPIEQKNIIGTQLDINNIAAACDALAQRRTILLDLGVANNEFLFLEKASITKPLAPLFIDNSFYIESSQKQDFVIYNFNITPFQIINKTVTMDGQDGLLNVVLYEKTGMLRKQIIVGSIACKEISIQDKDIHVILDNLFVLKTPISIKIKPRILKIITGKRTV